MQQRQGDKRRLGEILVALGAITPRELERQLRFQVEEVIFEVMSWREGYFSFVEGPLLDVPPAATVRIPTEALLMEGARRIDEWSRIESRIPHLGVIAALAPPPSDGGGELDLLPPEWEVLAAVDGQRDVRAIARELGRSEFDVAKTLFGLESAGVVVLADPGTLRRERTSGATDLAALVGQAEEALARKDFETARGMAEQAGSLHPHDPVLHPLLGPVRAARRVAVNGLERPPHLADAHDLYARILADKRDYERAFDEWDMARRIAPGHMGALKGLAFLYFKVGDVAQAVAHLEEAERVAPDDFNIQQALAMVRGQPMGSAAARTSGHGGLQPGPPSAPSAASTPPPPPPAPLPPPPAVAEEPMAPPA